MGAKRNAILGSVSGRTGSGCYRYRYERQTCPAVQQSNVLLLYGVMPCSASGSWSAMRVNGFTQRLTGHRWQFIVIYLVRFAMTRCTCFESRSGRELDVGTSSDSLLMVQSPCSLFYFLLWTVNIVGIPVRAWKFKKGKDWIKGKNSNKKRKGWIQFKMFN